MNKSFLEKEIDSCNHNISEAEKLPKSNHNVAYINKCKKELKKLNIKLDKVVETINSITFDNCHLVVEILISKDIKIMEAIVNEYEAQIRFGVNDGK